MNVKRIEKIEALKSRYANLMRQRRHKLANEIWRRLSDLMLKQLKAENRRG